MNALIRQTDSQPTDIASDSEQRIARIEVYDSFVAAEPVWRQLVGEHAQSTPYQRFEWVSLWHRHISSHQGVTPLIVTGADSAGTPLFLWPLARRDNGSLITAGFFGERHANLNAGLWRRDFAGAATADDLRAVLTQVARSHAIDLFAFLNQPRDVGAIANPLLLLPHQQSPNDVYVKLLGGETVEAAVKNCLSSAMRGRLRTKERKLQKRPGYRYARATTAADVERVLDAFLLQKAAYFVAQGIENAFAAPDITGFLRAACLDGLADGRPVIELHALEDDSEVIAVFGGVNDGHRMSCMFNSYSTGESGRWSPGLILLMHLVASCAQRRIREFDLGAGYASYKPLFCKTVEHPFDSFLPFSARGQVGALGLRTTQHLKRWVKSTPVVWDAAKAVRRRLFG